MYCRYPKVRLAGCHSLVESQRFTPDLGWI
jgi:hypothetical protein